MRKIDGLNTDSATDYHYGKFPPGNIEFSRLAKSIGEASSAIARYDGMLKGLQESEVLLAPLRTQEAVISSRIEGTVTTLDEVLRYEAVQHDDGTDGREVYRNEIIEVFCYSRALKRAQQLVAEGLPICGRMMKSAHREMLFFGRGADKQPGEYKKDQNYVADTVNRDILFIPISPDRLADGIADLETFINDDQWEVLIQTAIAHVEFEALHPFKDGNGRIGRMLITLMLWDKGMISQPHFYISRFFEHHREEYVEKMRQVSADGNWTDWCAFFLEAIKEQANEYMNTVEAINQLYDEMKDEFREILKSKWSGVALDYIFANPVFRNSRFTHLSGIPGPTAARMTPLLLKRGLLEVIGPASGRRSAVYAFEPLLKIVRN